jgi:hypothetical protein
MSRTGNKRRGRKRNRKCNTNNAAQLNRALDWFLKDVSFRDFNPHGNTTWKPTALIIQTLLWIWSDKRALTDAFDDSRLQSQKLTGTVALTTYQGLAGALQTWTDRLLPALLEQLHRLMQSIGRRRWKVGRWVAFGVDGSRDSVGRTLSNEQAFCASNYGNGKTAKYRKKKTKGKRKRKKVDSKQCPQGPQIWITMIWHMGLCLPWCWMLGPSNASERGHLMSMIRAGKFPKKALFVGDAGFVGFDFWQCIIGGGYQFLVRVGGNVTLLEKLGYDIEKRGKGIVYCWPKNKMRSDHPPLVLRVIRVRLGRKKKAVLLTSVLDEAELSIKEALSLYEKRWGIELEFRNLKQTFGRSVLRSRRSDRALNELTWSILGLAVVELFALKQQMPLPQADPTRLSVAGALRAVRKTCSDLSYDDAEVDDFETQLRLAVTDDYQRSSSKTARYHPQRKHPPSCGLPIIARADSEQRKKARALALKTAA